MMRALYTAATGMIAKQIGMDVISNNLANVNTSGFKKSRVDFQDLMYQTLRVPGATVAQGSRVPAGIQVGLGTRASAIAKVFGQGDFVQTENPMDLVVEGDGFFKVILPDGSSGYTRDGSFKLDSEGRIVTSDGYVLDPEISISTNSSNVSVGTDGTVSITSPTAEAEEVGKITISRFVNPTGLMSMGRNVYKPTAASGEAMDGTPGLEGFGTIGQGFLETSNVKVVEEMVNLIVAQRAYEVNSKAIQTADEMLSTANNLRR